MVCSPEQLAANRKNSKRSTGPKTPEGKAKSRRNGLKHGLTGVGVVLPDEDLAEVESRFEAFEADLKPANDVARFLARRAALLSVRLDRCVREEAARVTLDMLEAPEAEEDARALEFDRLTRSIADHPAESVRKLRRSEEGIAWLIESWRKIRPRLFDGKGQWSHEVPQRLTGREPEMTQVSRIAVLTLAMSGRFDWLEADDWPDLPPQERRTAARDEMAALIDREILGLERAREALDRRAIDQARAGAAARAIFDPSKAATLARKYEAAAERGFYQALQQIERINEAAQEAAEIEETPKLESTCDEMASSFPAQARPSSRRDLPRQEAQSGGSEADGRGSSRGNPSEVSPNSARSPALSRA